MIPRPGQVVCDGRIQSNPLAFCMRTAHSKNPRSTILREPFVVQTSDTSLMSPRSTGESTSSWHLSVCCAHAPYLVVRTFSIYPWGLGCGECSATIGEGLARGADALHRMDKGATGELPPCQQSNRTCSTLCWRADIRQCKRRSSVRLDLRWSRVHLRIGG